MSKQKEKTFTWVLKKLSSLQDEKCYSRPFAAADCDWRICAYRKGDRNDGYLSLYLELADPESLPSGWRRQVKFRLTLVNKILKQSTKVLEGKNCFDASAYGWGFEEFLPLYKLHGRGNGFLVRNNLIIVAQVQILPATAVPEPLSCKDGNQSDDASEEASDDDDESQEDPDDDDASSPVSDDGGSDICLLNQPNACKNASHTVGNRGMSCNNVAVFNSDIDDAPKEDHDDDGTGEEVPDDGSSLVLNDRDRDIRSLHQLRSFEDASQTVENGGTGCNNMASVTETSNNFLKEIQPVKDVNGFQVFSSQVQSVSHIFERHPDIALGFRPKNQQIRRGYMDALLSLVETLCQSPEKLSEDDLSNADDTLVDLIDAGFELDWLKKKLEEVSEKKKIEQGSGALIQTMEEQLQKMKLMFLDLELQLQKEKAKALAARAPLSFKDVIC